MNKEQYEKEQAQLINYLQKVPKSLILDFIIRDALASGRGLSDIFNIRSHVPNIMNLSDPKSTKGETSMRKKYTEEQRIRDLESIRTPRNSHIIDAAIKNGQVAEYAALETIEGNYHLTHEEAADIAVAEMIEEVHRLTAKQKGKTPQACDNVNQNPPRTMSKQERIDAVIAAVDWN
ncbi:hypothetical protein [Paenibacillus sp. NPDC057934]|uniref:hypothetical protein n=1 Tax=Paenibacillus sp. NPDC057934 TaxID=3346282 RepID=UPI0036D96769